MLDVPPTLNEPGNPVLGSFTADDGYRWLYRRFSPPGQQILACAAGSEPAAQARICSLACAAGSEPAAQAREPIGRVVFIHGIQSHGGWYPRSCAKIAAAGHEVYFLDRRGCGLNRERRGDMPGFRRALDDIAEFLRSLPQDGKPKFLAAISWGGKLGVALQYRYPGLVDGLALLCPGIVSKVHPTFYDRLRITLARVFRPCKFFPIPLNDPKLFTNSLDWQRFVEEDQLGLREATSRMLFGNFALNIYLRRARKLVKLPILLLLAEHDDIIDNAGVRAYVKKLPSIDKQIIEYAGAHHTLEFEPEGHVHVEDLIGWLDRHVRS